MEFLLKVGAMPLADCAQMVLFIVAVAFCIRMILEGLWNIKPFSGCVVHNHERSGQETKSQETAREAA